MAFYDLSKQERKNIAAGINSDILNDLINARLDKTTGYFAGEDTYVRKSAYLFIGRLYFEQEALQLKIIELLNNLLPHEDFKIRQTVINTAGEIGRKDFSSVRSFFDRGLFDEHHSPRNAVIGSIKKMAEVNPEPVLSWAKEYLNHHDKEIRRQICHGIELRGRKFPQDILPLLKELQHDRTARVRNTLVHVLGQVSYKKGCMAIVVEHLKTWDNKALVAAALEEIIDVHDRYKDFAVLTQEQAREYIRMHYRN